MCLGCLLFTNYILLVHVVFESTHKYRTVRYESLYFTFKTLPLFQRLTLEKCLMI